VEPVIAESARKHGIHDEDMIHAYRNAIRSFDLDEGLIMRSVPADPGTYLRSVSSAATPPPSSSTPCPPDPSS
jgi:hypothetical protein